jgi:hypothetical protein
MIYFSLLQITNPLLVKSSRGLLVIACKHAGLCMGFSIILILKKISGMINV